MIDNGSKNIQPIPLGVTFSNAVSKLKAQSSNFSFHWNVAAAKEMFVLWALSFENDTPSGIGCTFISFMDCTLVRFTVYWSVCVPWNCDVSVECWMMSTKVMCSLLTVYEWLRAHVFSQTHCVQVLTDSSAVLFAAPCTWHGQCWQRCMLASLVCETSSRPSWIDWPKVDCVN